ncbi:MAG: low molecular weight phosphotyrosine protein phosphatase [Limnobacter sp.]|nr:low molecular weight phosphotyrosine protein phosphatase [Limnobacter sp.]
MKQASSKLLVVCTANICRSPMAEAVLRKQIATRGLRTEVSSAGVHAQPDQPAHPLSIEVVAQAGVADLSTHRSRPLSPLLLRNSDIVLCMEHAHRDEIVARAPEAAGRVRLLGHWLGTEIVDPVNGSIGEFVECLKLMSECIDQWLTRLTRQGLLQ